MKCSDQDKPLWYKSLPKGQHKTYTTGALIAVPGNSEDRVFVLETGKARICLLGSARTQTLGYLDQGSVYVTHTPCWVEATQHCRVQSWPLRQIKSLIEVQPVIAIEALKEVGRLLSSSIAMIEDLAFRSVESRLARYLITEASRSSRQIIELPGTTEAFANLLGTSRQTLSSLLTKMEKQQLISRPEKHRLKLVDISQLQQLSDLLSAG